MMSPHGQLSLAAEIFFFPYHMTHLLGSDRSTRTKSNRQANVFTNSLYKYIVITTIFTHLIEYDDRSFYELNSMKGYNLIIFQQYFFANGSQHLSLDPSLHTCVQRINVVIPQNHTVQFVDACEACHVENAVRVVKFIHFSRVFNFGNQFSYKRINTKWLKTVKDKNFDYVQKRLQWHTS